MRTRSVGMSIVGKQVVEKASRKEIKNEGINALGAWYGIVMLVWRGWVISARRYIGHPAWGPGIRSLAAAVSAMGLARHVLSASRWTRESSGYVLVVVRSGAADDVHGGYGEAERDRGSGTVCLGSVVELDHRYR